jgi:hypothetical protein
MAIEPPEITDGRDQIRGASSLTGETAPTQQLVAATMGDRCVNCGAPLSSDQRYCVHCGERRGKPRFTLPSTASPAGAVVPAAPRVRRRPRPSSGATLVAGVGTLLLAMGVGVLIGHANSIAKQGSAPPLQVVTVNGGSGSGAAVAAPSKKSRQDAKGSNSKAKASAKGGAPSAAVAAKAAGAASKVLGGSKNLPPATVTVGQQGHGPGFNKGGKFDGTFFGH